MKKTEAINAIKDATDLEGKFKVAYEILEHSPPISQDKMLMLYAFYKQAVYGDYVETNEKDGVSNYIQTFKNNAWSQVKNFSKRDSMEKYIELTIQIIENHYKD